MLLVGCRKPEHDLGSVQGVVQQYLRQRAVLGAGGRAEGADGGGGRKAGKQR